MKKYILIHCFLICVSSAFAQIKTNHKQVAKTIVDLLLKKDYEKIVAYYDTAYKKSSGVDRLSRQWENVLSKSGEFKKVEEAVETENYKFAMVTIPLVFSKRKTDVKIIFNKKNMVSGLNFFPELVNEPYALPAYYDSTKVIEKPFNFSSDGYDLTGTLSAPLTGKQLPALILVHGSGANDRDETVYSTKIFKDIALGLASKGVVVARYDKRSKTYPSKARSREKTVRDETINDVLVAYDSLKRNPSVDPKRIFLLGHGFGGMMLPRIAKELPDAGGLIILAANAGPLEDVIYDEASYLLNGDSVAGDKKIVLLDSMMAQVHKIKQLSSASPDTSHERILMHSKSYWIDLSDYKQTETAKELHLPIYIVHCERDYQVTMKEYDAWKSALEKNKNVHFKLYTKLNHLMQEGSGKSTPAEYIKHANVPEYVIDDFYGWITQKKK
jgi:dienelactone hydrolase